MIARAPTFGRIERVRLYVSYQRYAFLMAAIAVGIVGGAALLFPTRWYLWLVAMCVAPWFLAGAVTIARKFPRKLRATLAARRKIARGTFHARSVRQYCGDPCFRVVANEILREAGVPGHERRKLVRAFAQEKRSQSEFVLFVDRTNGVKIRVEGSGFQNWPRPQ